MKKIHLLTLILLLATPFIGLAQADSYEIPFRKQSSSGLMYVDVSINGLQKEFIFDTGASTISISSSLFRTLLNAGKISRSDVINVINVMIANGQTIRANIVRLNSVKLGNYTLYNVDAIVMPDANAPLLIGQSFFSNFETVAIDNKNKKVKLSNPVTDPVANQALDEIRFIPCTSELIRESGEMATILDQTVSVSSFSTEANVPPPVKATAKLSDGVTVRYFDNQNYRQAAEIADTFRKSGRYSSVYLENMLPFFNNKPIPGYLEVWIK